MNKYDIHSQAWTEVFQKCGGEKDYAKLMGKPQETVNDWRNKPGMRVPPVKLMLTEMLVGVSLERTNVFFPEDNKTMREFQQVKNQLHYREMSLDEIVIENIPYLPGFEENDRILVDNEGFLISGLWQIEMHKKNHQNKVKVFVLDMKALILELRSLNEMGDFSKSERIAIGYRLKQLIGSRKGQHPQLLNLKSEKDKINVNHKAEGETVRYQVEWVGKTNQHLAKILGFSGKNTYYRTEKICQQGIRALIDALNEGLFSIDKAFEISKLPEDKQNEFVEQQALNRRGVKT